MTLQARITALAQAVATDVKSLEQAIADLPQEVVSAATAAAPVQSVAGKTGAVALVKADVGLGNVDNTADTAKPVSTAQQTALDAKQDKLVSGTTIKTVGGTSILGSGDISVGVGDVTLTGTQTLTNKTLNSPTINNASLTGMFNGDVTFNGSHVFIGWSGQTFLRSTTTTRDGVVINGRDGGSGSFRVTIQPTTLTASRTLTLPDNSGMVLTTGRAVAVNEGGTGATSAADARSNLGAQATLISGTNIATINGQSLLQAGNLTVGLGSFAASYSNTETNTTIKSSNISIGGTDTDVDFTIVPKGTGALQLDIPDGTATGGNKRGYNAVDLQKQRTVATQVASGTRSFVVGGENVASSGYDIAMGYLNSASGFYSFAVGYSNEASGQGSLALGYDNSAAGFGAVALGRQSSATGLEAIAIGRSNSASSSNSCAIGRSNTASSPYATALGWNNTASANYNSAVGSSNSVNTSTNSGAFGNSNTVAGVQAYAFGSNNQVSAQYAMALGIYGVANAYGATTIGVSAQSRGVMNSLSIGSGTGGRQSSVYQLVIYTTNNTATVATTNGQTADANNRLTLPDNSVFYGRIRLIARTSTGNNAKSWEGKFLIRRGANAAATTLVGSSLTSDYADSGLSAVTAALSADTVNGGLTLTVTGIASTVIFWTARIDTVENGL